MTSRSPSMSSTKGRKSPSLQVILIVFVSLFILFLWLNFALTQEIETIGREIQAQSRELSIHERRHEALLKEISVVGSQQEMANQATLRGYQPQTPVYLTIGEPLIQAINDALADGGQSAALSGGGEEWPSQPANSLLEVLARQFETSQLGDGP